MCPSAREIKQRAGKEGGKKKNETARTGKPTVADNGGTERREGKKLMG